jgi:hypothetical protein
MRKKIIRGTKVKILNIDYLYWDDDDGEFLLNQVVRYTGNTQDKYYKDDALDNYDENDEEDNRTEGVAYEFEVTDIDGEPTIVYLFKHNFKVLPNEEPKDDYEWLDRVQQNFRH